jgi:hypothetical protein
MRASASSLLISSTSGIACFCFFFCFAFAIFTKDQGPKGETRGEGVCMYICIGIGQEDALSSVKRGCVMCDIDRYRCD